MLFKRIITALLGIPLIIAVLYLGDWYGKAFFALLGFLALIEYFSMMKHKGCNPIFLPSFYFLFICMFRNLLTELPLLFYMGVLLLVLTLIAGFSRIQIKDAALSLLGALYIGFLLSYAMAIIDMEQGFVYMILAFILTWASDTGGYLFGRLWGKSPLAPSLSPNKTWEGSFGGLLLTLISLLLFVYFTKIENLNWAYLLLLGVAASLSGQAGDLFESSLKRYFGVKDSGHIIPGHGGVLDRFDSFLLVLPAVYYFVFAISV